MSKERELVAALAESLGAKMRELCEELIEKNAHAMAHELLRSDDSNGSAGMRFGFQLGNGAVGMDAKISWSRKFEDTAEGSFRFDDPMYPGLPGMDGAGDDGRKVTIRTGGQEVTTTLGAIKRAGRRGAKLEPEEN